MFLLVMLVLGLVGFGGFVVLDGSCIRLCGLRIWCGGLVCLLEFGLLG